MGKVGRGPSMHDVAAVAGVSHQTVSRVLNGYVGIRPETRARVVAAIEELGYRRNMAARQLATGRSDVIGVVMPETHHFGPMSTLYAIEAAAKRAGLKPLITTATPEEGTVGDALDFLLGRSVDALVVMAQQPEMLDAVKSVLDRLPVLFVLTGDAHGPRSVAVDQRRGVRLVVEHLVSLGHRRIQHIAGPGDYLEARLRRAALREVLAEHGLEELPILSGDWSADSGYRAGLEVDPSATAVFAANDPMALGAMHALEEGGRSVPGDVSLVGFDDVPESAHARPGLTTVHQDFTEVGLRAVQVLMDRLNGVPESHIEPIEPWLIARESSGPVPLVADA